MNLRKMACTAGFAVLFAVSIPVYGLCILGIGDCSTDIDVKLDKFGKSMEKAAESIAQLKEIDPDLLGLKRLMTENKALQNQISSLTEELIGATSGVAIHINDRRLEFRVVQYTGSHRVDAWIDTEQNWYWQNKRFDDKEIRLPINKDGALAVGLRQYGSTYHPNPFCGAQDNSLRYWQCVSKASLCRGSEGKRQDNMFAAIKSSYEQVINDATTQFLKTGAIIPAPISNVGDLAPNMLSYGAHTINFKLTPVAADANNKWSLRARIVSVSNNGENTRVIKEFDLDSDLFPNHTIGDPLEPVVAYVKIERPDEHPLLKSIEGE